MKLSERYRRLTFWNKVAMWGSAASIIGLVLFVAEKVTGGSAPGPSQVMIASPGSVQVGGDVAITMAEAPRRVLSDNSRTAFGRVLADASKPLGLDIQCPVGDGELVRSPSSCEWCLDMQNGRCQTQLAKWRLHAYLLEYDSLSRTKVARLWQRTRWPKRLPQSVSK